MTDGPERVQTPGGKLSPQVLLQRTDWASLDHAMGRADDLPLPLRQLTDENPDVRAKALDFLERVNHQNTIYSATPPAAVYLASILTDPRTGPPIEIRCPTGRVLRSLRAELLDWLAAMADDVSDEAIQAAAAHGCPIADIPEIRALRAARPAIFAAVAPFLNDPDPDTRESATTAAGRLLDAPELADHRTRLLAPLRSILHHSRNQRHHTHARDTLLAWGEQPPPEHWDSAPPF